MAHARTVLAVLAIVGATSPAFAQDSNRGFNELEAERINPFQILIELEFDGGACDAVGRAELGEFKDGTLAVTFPTSSTSEVCTMQIKPVEVRQAIESRDEVRRIEVVMTAPDGRVFATGTTQVEID